MSHFKENKISVTSDPEVESSDLDPTMVSVLASVAPEGTPAPDLLAMAVAENELDDVTVSESRGTKRTSAVPMESRPAKRTNQGFNYAF